METNFRSTVLRFCNIDVRKTKQNNEFTTKMCDSSAFLQHWCPENKAKQRFHDQHVRQFYVFGTLMSRKQNKTMILRRQISCSQSKTMIFSFFSSKTSVFFWFSSFFHRKPLGFFDFRTFSNDSSTFSPPRRFLSDSSTFWAKNAENTVFSHVFTIFYDTKAYKNEKKNAANDAQGKQNTISRHFMRNQKTSQVR